jgi:hypothetical protein
LSKRWATASPRISRDAVIGSDRNDSERTFGEAIQLVAYAKACVLRSTVQLPTSSPFIQAFSAVVTRLPSWRG